MHYTEGDINFSEARARWQELQTHKETQQLLEDDARYFLHQSLSTPCLDVIEHASGSYIHTKSGKAILDFHGNNVHQVGFGNPVLIDALKDQMDKLSFCSRRYTNEHAVSTARTLAGLLPGDLNRCLFAPGGTTAIGMAIKLARIVTGKHKIISCWDSFHGASLDAISAGGEAIFRKGLGLLMPGVERVPPAVSYRSFFGDQIHNDTIYADYIEYVIEKEGDIGAVLIETIRNTDVQIPSKAYWKKVREICDRHEALLILDEIPIALGRTGRMFAFEHFDIEPDIICLGKGLGGGIIPFAAMVTRDTFNVATDVSIGHYTHEKSPLGAVAAKTTIDFILGEHILEKVAQDEVYVAGRMQNLFIENEIIGDIRGKGLLWGIELVTDRGTKKRATDSAEKLMYHCLNDGLSFKVSQGNVLQLSPPLTISRDELEQAFSILEQNIKRLTKN